MKAISLAIEPDGDEKEEVCCSPLDKPTEGYKPTVYLSFPDSRLEGLPKSGTVTFRYKLVSTSASERNGKKSCSVELELSEITNATPAKKVTEISSVGEALAALKSGADEDGDED